MIQQLIMADKLTGEEVIICEDIKRKLQKCAADSNHNQIVRLPLDVYKFCRDIFKKQAEVGHFLLEYFLREFYFKDVKEAIALAQQAQAETLSPYVRVLVACKDIATIYLSQLFLRVFVLGLSVRLGEQWQQVVTHKTRRLVKELQIQLLVSGGPSFAEVMIKELEILAEQFACLEFYEGLRHVFAKCDTFHVQQWIDKKMEERRAQFEQKLKAPFQMPKQQSEKLASKKINKQKRVTISTTNFDQPKEIFETTEPSTVKAIVEAQVKQAQQPPSLKEIAAKMRLSGGGSLSKSLPKISHRLIYRSNRKAATQQETSAETKEVMHPTYDQSCFHSPQARKQESEPIEPTPTVLSVLAICQSPKEDSGVLCQATPPRTNKKRVQ